ncbi:MAG: heme-degrading monooxygenase HmoA [Chlamydiales bacterium]|jgi:heme-degrading monooxygenase HmoA
MHPVSMNGARQMQPDPRPPYYAVIFTSELTEEPEGYSEMAERMAELAAQQPGYIRFESLREGSLGITVSYWEMEEAIAQWSRHPEHLAAQAAGRDRWYRSYTIEIARVERIRSHTGQGR